jgi:membrane protein implicated in regulation of membrane protease activity
MRNIQHLLTLIATLCLLYGAGWMLWHQTSVDWEWSFAVFLTLALTIVSKGWPFTPKRRRL